MKILISPAKKRRADPAGFPVSRPLFLSEAEALKKQLSFMDYAELKALWRCSDAIAGPAAAQLARADLTRAGTAALLAYDGIQYLHMAPAVFDRQQLAYLADRLYILSGLYGALRPFDGVVPYRLEMQARLPAGGCRDLYAFWRPKLAQLLQNESLIINLASAEYAAAALSVPPARARVITCVFAQEKGGRQVQTGTLCKMARGEMVRHLADCREDSDAPLKTFCELGFSYRPERSSDDRFIYIKGEN